MYDFKASAKYSGAAYTNIDEIPFQVNIINPCALQTITIEPEILTSLSITYNLQYPTHVETFDPTHFTASPTESNCPNFCHTLSFFDESISMPVDTTIFQEVAGTPPEFRIQSNDMAKVGTYAFSISV